MRREFSLHSLWHLIMQATHSKHFYLTEIDPIPGLVVATDNTGIILHFEYGRSPWKRPQGGEYSYFTDREDQSKIADFELPEYERMLRDARWAKLKALLDESDMPF